MPVCKPRQQSGGRTALWVEPSSRLICNRRSPFIPAMVPADIGMHTQFKARRITLYKKSNQAETIEVEWKVQRILLYHNNILVIIVR